MKKRRIIIFISLLAMMILLGLLFRTERKTLNWTENYKMDSKQPFGTHVIHELLQSYFPAHGFNVLQDSIRGQLPEWGNEDANYVFIGEGMYMDSADVGTLLRFVEIGNTALISSRTIPFDLMFHLYYEECDGYPWDDYLSIEDTVAYFNLEHPNLRASSDFEYKYITKHLVRPYRWQYIESDYFCEKEDGLVAIGHMSDSLVNFARIRYGDGDFYLHTTPMAFTNIQMMDEPGLAYASKVFSHLEEGPIYWDEYSRISEWIGRQRNRSRNRSSRSLAAKSPLQYILGQPALAWAWYILLAMGMLFLAFRAKRKQRIIPVLEPNTNTSMEFIYTIGSLYFMQNDHKRLALQQMKLFQIYLRDHYQLQSREMDEDFAKKLIQKSGISEGTIDKILLLYNNIKSSSFVSENTLVEFHQLLDEFYKNCK